MRYHFTINDNSSSALWRSVYGMLPVTLFVYILLHSINSLESRNLEWWGEIHLVTFNFPSMSTLRSTSRVKTHCLDLLRICGPQWKTSNLKMVFQRLCLDSSAIEPRLEIVAWSPQATSAICRRNPPSASSTCCPSIEESNPRDARAPLPFSETPSIVWHAWRHILEGGRVRESVRENHFYSDIFQLNWWAEKKKENGTSHVGLLPEVWEKIWL